MKNAFKLLAINWFGEVSNIFYKLFDFVNAKRITVIDVELYCRILNVFSYNNRLMQIANINKNYGK